MFFNPNLIDKYLKKMNINNQIVQVMILKILQFKKKQNQMKILFKSLLFLLNKKELNVVTKKVHFYNFRKKRRTSFI